MYQNIDNMIYDADSCEAAICECKRMRKADITAAIIWVAIVACNIVFMLFVDIFHINIDGIGANIFLFMVLAFPGICSAIYMISKGTFGIFFAVIKTIFKIAYNVTMLPFFGWAILIFAGGFACIVIMISWWVFVAYPILDIISLSMKIQTLGHTKEAYAQYMKQAPEQ